MEAGLSGVDTTLHFSWSVLCALYGACDGLYYIARNIRVENLTWVIWAV